MLHRQPNGDEPRSIRRTHTLSGAFFIFLSLLVTFVSGGIQAAQSTFDVRTAYRIPIHGTIEPGMAHFLDRAMTDAREQGADIIILDLNTPGGRLDSVLEMRDRIMDEQLPVIAYVDGHAFSAGALLTIASDEIWMTTPSVFGAATPVNGGIGMPTDEKTVSAVRSVFRATAEAHGRDPAVAEAMVDANVVVEGLAPRGTLVTLTSSEAQDHGYLNGIADSDAELYSQLGVDSDSVTVGTMTFWERVVQVLGEPAVGSILLLVGIGLIVADALFAGLGFPAAAGALMLMLFFWGYALTGLAGWEDLLLVALGVVLIALEAFVIPGFGVAGILGGVSLMAGMVMSMTARDFGDAGFWDEATGVLRTIMLTLVVVLTLLVAFAYMLPRMVPATPNAGGHIRGLMLGATVSEGATEPSPPGWFTSILGGGERLERDEPGHTAMHERSKPVADSQRIRDEIPRT